MTTQFPYDEEQDPFAPVVAIPAGAPASASSVLLPALVDTGADLTVVPAGVPAALGLPTVGAVTVEVADGSARQVPVFAAELELAEDTDLFEVLALGDEALLGRNVLNRRVLILDGPGRRLRLA